VHWIHLSQDMEQWWALMNTIICVSIKGGVFVSPRTEDQE
jgi:hypothetical protein